MDKCKDRIHGLFYQSGNTADIFPPVLFEMNVNNSTAQSFSSSYMFNKNNYGGKNYISILFFNSFNSNYCLIRYGYGDDEFSYQKLS